MLHGRDVDVRPGYTQVIGSERERQIDRGDDFGKRTTERHLPCILADRHGFDRADGECAEQRVAIGDGRVPQRRRLVGGIQTHDYRVHAETGSRIHESLVPVDVWNGARTGGASPFGRLPAVDAMPAP